MNAITIATEPELSRDEFAAAVARLAERLADLATERDGARADWAEALEAACVLQQERDRERRRADEQSVMAFNQAKLAARFRDRFVEVSAELRRATSQLEALAVQTETVELLLDQARRRRLKGPRRWRVGRTGGRAS